MWAIISEGTDPVLLTDSDHLQATIDTALKNGVTPCKREYGDRARVAADDKCRTYNSHRHSHQQHNNQQKGNNRQPLVSGAQNQKQGPQNRAGDEFPPLSSQLRGQYSIQQNNQPNCQRNNNNNNNNRSFNNHPKPPIHMPPPFPFGPFGNMPYMPQMGGWPMPMYSPWLSGPPPNMRK